MNLKSWYTNLQKKPPNRCQQVQVPYRWPKTKIKPTNGLLTTNNRWIETNQWHKSCSHYQEGFSDQSLLMDQTGNTIGWQALFTTTRTCYSQKITLVRLACLCLLGSLQIPQQNITVSQMLHRSLKEVSSLSHLRSSDNSVSPLVQLLGNTEQPLAPVLLFRLNYHCISNSQSAGLFRMLKIVHFSKASRGTRLTIFSTLHPCTGKGVWLCAADLLLQVRLLVVGNTIEFGVKIGSTTSSST